jgi:drug/metabolite transporter (DMT)-like permease
MVAILLAFASAFSYGVADFFGGLATRRSPLLKVLPVITGTGLIALTLASPFLGAQFSRGAIIAGLLAGCSSLAGYVFVMRSLALGPMGAVAPITAVVAVVIPFTVGLVRGERMTLLGAIGAGLAMLSIALVSRSTEDATHPLSPKAAFTAVLGGLGFAGFLLGISSSPTGSGLAPVMLARVVSFTVFSMALIVKWKSVRAQPVDLKMSLASGSLDVWGGTAFMLGTRHGQLVLVSVIAALYPAFTVLLARVYLHERLERHQVVGLVSAAAAVTLLTVA